MAACYGRRKLLLGETIHCVGIGSAEKSTLANKLIFKIAQPSGHEISAAEIADDATRSFATYYGKPADIRWPPVMPS